MIKNYICSFINDLQVLSYLHQAIVSPLGSVGLLQHVLVASIKASMSHAAPSQP